MRVELTRSYDLAAAHFLPNAPAGHKCLRLHGHSYRIEVAIHGVVDEGRGWLLDYADIDQAVEPVLAQLDHRTLNDVQGLENATAEILCRWLWGRLASELSGLYRVTVAETPGTACSYFGED